MSGKYIPVKLRSVVLERAKERCEYCQSWMRNAIHSFHIDHIIPLDKEGKTVQENLALSCSGCNGAKSTRILAVDPVTQSLTSIFHPRQHSWSDHFAWSDDFLLVIGLTPIGRATVHQLRLSRSGLQNIRRLTYLAGEHPPVDL